MTVRDERELLRTNLLYHHWLGVDLCFVYDDGSTDGTLESVADLQFVRGRPSVAQAEVAARSDLATFIEGYDSHFTARQALNTAHAMDEARAAGVSWLLAIDADELVAVDLDHGTRDALRGFLAGQPASTEAVVFPPLEVVQRRVSYDDVMLEETLFKRTDVAASRETFDPFDGKKHSIPAIYGHTAGKTGVRLSANARPHTSHRFLHRDGSPLRSVTSGYLLHYYSHSFEAFVHKFRLIKDHPDRHLQGAEVIYQKRLWRDVVNRAGLDDVALLDYYRRWVMFDDAAVSKLRNPAGKFPFRRRAPLVEVPSVADALRRLRHATEDLGQTEEAGASVSR
jgi:catechol 2,3-dioxygenase-like lactoylglutathione lyase family enzyme